MTGKVAPSRRSVTPGKIRTFSLDSSQSRRGLQKSNQNCHPERSRETLCSSAMAN